MRPLTDAVAVSRLEGLIALRDRLAAQIDETASARDVAALSRQLTEVMHQIDDLTPKEDAADDLAALIPGPACGDLSPTR
ncbi:hypothetical protein [Nocardioides ochotonae]|uniref:hypothetical protein n=1 Tax=Nocardioides ochotonae TaxID=2685869 RepID=UPI00140BB399|nr:hypothetical protein [Nocardioides ochotonae]